jgi:hypothetical protein
LTVAWWPDAEHFRRGPPGLPGRRQDAREAFALPDPAAQAIIVRPRATGAAGTASGPEQLGQGSFFERIYWLSPFTCPTCRKVYKPAILWQSHCSTECQQLDPRNNRVVTAQQPQPDPLAPPRLPWK